MSWVYFTYYDCVNQIKVSVNYTWLALVNYPYKLDNSERLFVPISLTRRPEIKDSGW